MSRFPNDYEPTGLLAVDMVASIVSGYKRTTQALKTIYLSPKLFVQFTDFVKYKQSEEDEVKEIKEYTFDGVEVRMNSALMGEKVYFDFYDTSKRIEA